ncbi:MAG: hypothetical protein JWO58_1125 [Chitinophagaceae bacterium]|nr:hypothetical protein [Chitinophagaceae bacterium]
MAAGFEKMESKRGLKKDKLNNKKNGSSSREQQRNEDYEEYFNTRYGNKLYK